MEGMSGEEIMKWKRKGEVEGKNREKIVKWKRRWTSGMHD